MAEIPQEILDEADEICSQIAEFGKPAQETIARALMARDHAMTDVGNRLIEGAEEALSFARGESSAASITVSGHTYVPRELFAASEAARIKADGEVERLREALEPFARIADEIFRDGMNKSRQDDAEVWGFDRETMTYGDLRAARAALRMEPSTALEHGKTEGGGE